MIQLELKEQIKNEAVRRIDDGKIRPEDARM